jgi:P-type conjugative transfer protein TrbJ
MKKTLSTIALSLSLTLAAGLIQPKPAQAIFCSNCSQEVMEILRHVETIMQMAEEISQLEQQVSMMEQNLRQLPNALKNNPVDGLNQLARLVSQDATLRADQNTMIQVFNELYPDQSKFAQLAGASDAEIAAANAVYQQNYDDWSAKLDTGIMATFQVTGRQLQEMSDSGQLEAYISNLLQTPNGQEQALEAGNQLAAMQLQDSMKTRELIATMAQGEALRDAKSEKEDEMNKAKWEAWMKTDKLENRERETGKAY